MIATCLTSSRCVQLSGRRAYIRYDRQDSGFWFNPVIDERRPHNNASGFPCNRGDIFLKLGMRGARLIPWRLREGDVFRLGQAYVLVSKIRLTSIGDSDEISALSPWRQTSSSPELRKGDDQSQSDDDAEGSSKMAQPQCYICYETGDGEDPLINPCQCAGSVKYVHLQCLARWIQPGGSCTVNTHCPVCKSR